MMKPDIYLDSLYSTFEMCQLIVSHAWHFSIKDAAKANTLAMDTLERIADYKKAKNYENI